MRLRWALYHAPYRCAVHDCDRWAVRLSPVCRCHDDQWLEEMARLAPDTFSRFGARGWKS